ncbi:MAG TPA: FAD-dependent oxidoreductase [Myxococcota bacterium]|nr:FAD-dependent oxidoreductase [Myxococcota bacterium]
MLALALMLTACQPPDKDDVTDDTDDTDSAETLDCEVVIVGGGAGGLHTAMRLAPSLGDGVCLFEKEAAFGGRIKDEPLDPADPASPRIGTGARRVMEGQQLVFDLATELGITLETPPDAADLINARGAFAFAKDDLLSEYPTLDPHEDEETWLYDQLRFGPARADAASAASFEAYGTAAVGAEGWAFLHDMSRFRADFSAPLDAAGYLDYLDEEWDVCCAPSYPVGGMSRFIVGMAAAAEADGARLFLSEPVTAIRRDDAGGYTIETSAHTAHAAKVVIAAPPSALDHIEGDVVDDIQAQQAYQDIVGVKVVTISQWWPTSWWLDVRRPDDTPIWRAWTTEHCLNFIEIPIEPYAAAQHVTRSVYNDDLDCSEFWEDLAADGIEAVEAEVREGLEHLFVGNGLTTDVVIPDPIKTTVQIWPAAWHWLGAGASVTNAELMAWAADPLDGEEVGLVGEAYNVQRSGWSDGAYKSSWHLLETRYGMSR